MFCPGLAEVGAYMLVTRPKARGKASKEAAASLNETMLEVSEFVVEV
jgi:hypothetical protein